VLSGTCSHVGTGRDAPFPNPGRAVCAGGTRDVTPPRATSYVFTVLLGARASCPRRRDAGGTPALPGARITPGVDRYGYVNVVRPATDGLWAIHPVCRAGRGAKALG